VVAVIAVVQTSALTGPLVFAVIAAVCVFAVAQSIFGVGLLLFGTPTLLLLGLPFELVLAYLLPCSIAVSALQVITTGGLTLEPIRRQFLVYTAPAVLFATGAALLLGSPHQIRAIVGAVLLLTAALRLSPYQTALAGFVRRHLPSLLVTLGLVHGLSNLGGGLLTVVVGSTYADKASIRRHIAFAYGMMASIQLVTVFVTARPQVSVPLMLLLTMLAAAVYLLLGQRVFRKTGQRAYQFGLTGMIMTFGALLLGQA
jgi:uncharacterized protein